MRHAKIKEGYASILLIAEFLIAPEVGMPLWGNVDVPLSLKALL